MVNDRDKLGAIANTIIKYSVAYNTN